MRKWVLGYMLLALMVIWSCSSSGSEEAPRFIETSNSPGSFNRTYHVIEDTKYHVEYLVVTAGALGISVTRLVQQ